MPAILAYLWASVYASIAVGVVYLTEYLFNFQNRTLEMAICCFVFLSVRSQKNAEILARWDISTYRPEMPEVENTETATKIKDT